MTPRVSPRRRRGGLRRTLLHVAAVAFALAAFAPASSAAVSRAGGAGPSFADGIGPATATNEQSKVWWNDGAWWGVVWDDRTADFHIFRLDLARRAWIDTGVAVDDRERTRSDALWDGARLYVVSHKYSRRQGADSPSRLYRFRYLAAERLYVLDAGFPTTVNRFRPEALVLDKDSTGQLWATWTQSGRVYVNRTRCTPGCDDRLWGEPFALPVAGARVAPDDVSSLVAFDGKVGVMWSNQREGHFHFAVHDDGDPDARWTATRRIRGFSADDHISLKADRRGRVVAAVKTSARSSSRPLIVVLVRDPASGGWHRSAFGLRSDGHTRPVVTLDGARDSIHVFASGPAPPGRTDPRRHAIYEKEAAVPSPVFPAGLGQPVLAPRGADVSNPTSTKQVVSARTGLLVLASDVRRKRYWWSLERVRATASAPWTSVSKDPSVAGPRDVNSLPERLRPFAVPLAALAGGGAVVATIVLIAAAVQRPRRRSQAAEDSVLPMLASTPEDIRKASLPRRVMGYDPGATEALLDDVATRYAAALEGQAELRRRLDALESQLARLVALEQEKGRLEVEVESLRSLLEETRDRFSALLTATLERLGR